MTVQTSQFSPPSHLLAWLALLFALVSLGCAASMPNSVASWRSSMKTHVTSDEHQLRYLDEGPRDGEAILLLHGLPTNSSLYREVIPRLTEQGYRVIAPDIVGYGASSKPTSRAEYALEKQGARLVGLLSELRLNEVSMVVHDFGGIVGWELLSQDPSRIARILVMNTTAYHQGFRPPMEMRMLAGGLGAMMSGMMGSGSMGEKFMGDFLKDNTGDEDSVDANIVESVWWAMHEGSAVPMRTMAMTFSEVSNEFPRYQEALRSFQGPTAILWGDRDKVLKFDPIGTMFSQDLRIAKEHQRRLPKAGHFLMLDAPEETARSILSLMQQDAKVVKPVANHGLVRSTEFTGPAPGPSITAAMQLADRGLAESDEHDVRGDTRMRVLLGGAPAYALGFDASIGYSDGLAYRAALYPLGIGMVGGGSQISLVAGAGVRDAGAGGARFEAPIALDIAWQLGPVRALSWGHIAWSSHTDLQWEGALGLRLGGSEPYFPHARAGSGPYIAAIASGVGEASRFGLAIGMELGDGR